MIFAAASGRNSFDMEGIFTRKKTNTLWFILCIVSGIFLAALFIYLLVHESSEIDIDDIILNVDEAIRVMVIRNGEKTVYAKESKVTKEAEPNTTKFVSNSIAVLEQRKDFKPKKKDRFTIVVWIEGDDPECKNELLGGEIKMHMDITEEHVDNNKKKK